MNASYLTTSQSRTKTTNKFARMALFAAVIGGSVAMSRPAMAQEAAVTYPGYARQNVNVLEQMTAPVALYPDAVLADVLVASTHPQQVISAANYLNAGYSPAALDSQGWDLSVASVARFPAIVNYLAANSGWMSDLGTAYLNQPSDVMAAVQTLRFQAQAAGNLVSNDVQQVIIDGGLIQIIPADPRYVVLPVYDPAVVYAARPTPVACVTFGPRVEVGAWLALDLDWHDRAVYSGTWGQDRPWWHRDERMVYVNDRPGIDHPTTVINRTTVHYNTVVRNDVTRVDVRPARVVTEQRREVETRSPAIRNEPARPQGLLQSGRGAPGDHAQATERTATRTTVETRTQVSRGDAGGRSHEDRGR